MNNPIKQNADLIGRADIEAELLGNLALVADELKIGSHSPQLLINIVNLRISLKKFMYLLSDKELRFMHATVERNMKLIDKMNRVLVKSYKPE